MAMATSNRLLPILAGSVLLILVFVTTKSCSPDEEAAVVLDSVPEAPAPDADTPADTIKTLTANVAAMTTEVEALRRDNAALRRENQGLMTSRTQIEENVATRLKRELLAREKTQANRDRIDAGVLSSLTARRRTGRVAVETPNPCTCERYPGGAGTRWVRPWRQR